MSTMSDKIYSVYSLQPTQSLHTISATEEWRAVADWPYQVSNLGNVRRLAGTKTNWKTVGNLKIQKIGRPGRQYAGVLLSDKGKRPKTFYVHHLVAAAFMGPTPKGMEIDHKDGDKLNPQLCNLEFKTPSRNIIGAVERGHRGKNRWNARFTEDDIRAIRRMKNEGIKIKEIAAAFNASIGTIGNIVCYRNWRHVA